MTKKNSQSIDEIIDDVVRESKVLLARSTLDKYIMNPMMNQRLVHDASERRTILSSESGNEKYKQVSDFELKENLLGFFKNHRSAMQTEFKKLFLKKIGAEKYKNYVYSLSQLWTKGRQGRNRKEVQSLMQSVNDFLAIYGGQPKNLIVGQFSCGTQPPLFSTDDTQTLLLINKQLLDYYFQDYAHLVSKSKSALSFSTNYIWLHRGIDLKVEWEEGQKYKEKAFLNSYSLSVGVSEKFSSILGRKNNSIVSWKAYDLIDRVFAFYGFIPGMCDRQLEVITIPTFLEANITKKNSDKNIVDYEIGYY